MITKKSSCEGKFIHFFFQIFYIILNLFKPRSQIETHKLTFFFFDIKKNSQIQKKRCRKTLKKLVAY